MRHTQSSIRASLSAEPQSPTSRRAAQLCHDYSTSPAPFPARETAFSSRPRNGNGCLRSARHVARELGRAGARASTIHAPSYIGQSAGITHAVGLTEPAAASSRSPSGRKQTADRETGRRYVPALKRFAGRAKNRQNPGELPIVAVPDVTDECGERGGPPRARVAGQESSATRLDSNPGPCIIRQALPHRNRAGKGARRLDRVDWGRAGEHRMHHRAKGHLA